MTAAVSYLLDTNVLSETRKLKPDPGVLAFLQSADPGSIFLSVLTLGELRKGIAAKKLRDPEATAAARLSAWLTGWKAASSIASSLSTPESQACGENGPANARAPSSTHYSRPPLPATTSPSSPAISAM